MTNLLEEHELVSLYIPPMGTMLAFRVVFLVCLGNYGFDRRSVQRISHSHMSQFREQKKQI